MALTGKSLGTPGHEPQYVVTVTYSLRALLLGEGQHNQPTW